MSDSFAVPLADEPPSSQTWRPSVNPWLIVAAMMLPSFMELLDTAIVNVALPQIAGNLSASTNEATWVLTSYLISNAIILPASAWFGRVFGRKRFFMTCVALFTVTSAFCGIAQSLGFLVAARVLQGLGGGALQPIAQTVILESFPARQHGIAMAVFGTAVVTAPAIGPTLGGWLADTYSWRWCFYINLPVGLVTLIMSQAFLEDPPYLRRQGRPQVDYLGFALMAIALGSLQLVLDKGQEEDWFEATWICVTSGLCVASSIAFILYELRVQHPIIDLRVLRNRTFTVGTLLMAAGGVVLYSTTVMVPLFLQTLVNYPALQAGLAVSPRGLGSIAGLVMIGPLIGRINARILIVLGFLLFGYSCFNLGNFTLQMSIGTVVWATAMNGLAIGMLFVPLTTSAMANLPQEALGNATGIFNLMRNIGGSVGIATLATFLARDAQRHQVFLVDKLTPFDPVYQQWVVGGEAALAARGAVHSAEQALVAMYGTVLQQSSFAAFIDNFRLLGFFCLACIPAVFLLYRGRTAADHPSSIDC